MKIVDRATNPPAKCAVTGDIDGPFIDTGSWCQNVDPYIYLHVPWVEEVAWKLLDMIPKAEYEKLEERLEDLEIEIERLRHIEDMADALEVELSANGSS